MLVFVCCLLLLCRISVTVAPGEVLIGLSKSVSEESIRTIDDWFIFGVLCILV